jgi:hypothetical protein
MVVAPGSISRLISPVPRGLTIESKPPSQGHVWAMNASPYQLILQDDFGRLAPVLQQVHGGTDLRTAKGRFLVERGANRVARMMAAVMRLPREAPTTAIVLQIETIGRRERWRRWFGSQAVTTWQVAAGGLLRESSAPFAMHFRLQVADGGLSMHSQRVTLLGLGLPRLLAPRIVATEWPTAAGWQVDVEICLPLVGRLIRYSGHMELT